VTFPTRGRWLKDAVWQSSPTAPLLTAVCARGRELVNLQRVAIIQYNTPREIRMPRKLTWIHAQSSPSLQLLCIGCPVINIWTELIWSTGMGAWACNHERLSANPGHCGVLLWQWATWPVWWIGVRPSHLFPWNWCYGHSVCRPKQSLHQLVNYLLFRNKGKVFGYQLVIGHSQPVCSWFYFYLTGSFLLVIPMGKAILWPRYCG